MIELINYFISSFSSNLPTRLLIIQSLEYLQIESRLNQSILLQPYSKYNHLCKEGWLTSIWKVLSYYNLILFLPSNHHSNSNITNDSTIISNLLEIKIFSKE